MTDTQRQVGNRRTLPRRAFLRGGLLATGLAGCATTAMPPLRLLYRRTLSSPDQPPVIVIPGAFGSRLHDIRTGKEIWPGSASKLLLSGYRDLEIAIDADTLEPTDRHLLAAGIFDNGGGRDFYGGLIRTLERIGGYRLRQPGERPQVGERNCYLYLYDWRRDNVEAIQGLQQLIEQIRIDYADPKLKVDIVAHSNGGLVARYYARFGAAPLTSGAPALQPNGGHAIRRLIVLGTPNLGTLQAVLAHVRGEEMGMRRVDQEVVATWMSVAQLLPNPALPWLIDARGQVVNLSVFAIDTWRELGWSIFDPVVRARTIARHGGGAVGRYYLATLERFFEKSLTRGKLFAEALSAPAPASDIAPYVFGADCSPTLARLLVENVNGHIVARESPALIHRPVPGVDYSALMFQPGDLVVTRESLLGGCTSLRESNCTIKDSMRIEHSVFMCEEHQSLTGNASFQNNLLYTLLST